MKYFRNCTRPVSSILSHISLMPPISTAPFIAITAKDPSIIIPWRTSAHNTACIENGSRVKSQMSGMKFMC